MRLSFDSMTMAAVVQEAQPLVGARIQKIVQVDDHSIGLTLYKSSEHWLYISAHPQFARTHLLARRPPGISPPPSFCRELRSRITDAKIIFIRQRGLDRVLEIGISGEQGDFQLVAELMGKHSNIMLVDAEAKVVAALRWVGSSKSKRPILPGKPYLPPPFAAKPLITEASPEDDLRQFEGWSPSLQSLLDQGLSFDKVRQMEFEPTYAPDIGAAAFPFREGYSRASMSIAVEQHYAGLAEQAELSQAKAQLRSQLARVALARETALADIREAISNADRAAEFQKRGDLLLAYQHSIPPGADQATVWDYEGNELTLSLNPEQTALENAEALFTKARKAKARRGEIEGQGERLERDLGEIQSSLTRLEEATDLRRIEELRDLADQRKWLHKHVVATTREERPFAGHSVREFLSPAGWRVLVGTNATSNDYLTTRVGKPNDWWLHVRGAPSAHVVLQTANQPLRVQKADLEFAAGIAIRFSPLKHSSLVSVDYTLKKYVRKPHGSAPGLAVYTHEKTLHIESK